MRKITHFLIISATIFAVTSCKHNVALDSGIVKDTVKRQVNEAELLYSFLEKSGNYINSDKFPSMVSAEDVYTNLKSYFVIDIRDHADYTDGHIDGAVNVSVSGIIDYVSDSIAASAYDKIVIVCYSNNHASYTASMLRMLGYGNVYSMTFGMSAWDKNTASVKWLKNISDKYVGKLEIKDNPKHAKGNYPEIKTGESDAYAILKARAQKLLSAANFQIKVDTLFAHPEKYYIINYWPHVQYQIGHVPGAVQYTPKTSLTKNTFLSTLPLDKPIVAYCYSGQQSSFLVAYLQLLGYNAVSLNFGANSFMHDKLISAGIGHAFIGADDIKNYPMTEGEKPSKESVVKSDSKQSSNSPTAAPVNVPKKKKGGGGGC
jgi:rhodanese-related sulfurtransferase